MLGALVWFTVSALLTDFIGYWLHRWAHKPHSPMFRAHMTHHLVTYPPSDPLSGKYRSSGKDSLARLFAPFFVAYLLICWLVPPISFWPAAAGAVFSALASSVLHDLTHIRGSLVWRKNWLLGIAIRHHSHHVKMRRNFGIVVPWWDVVFRTRRPKMTGSAPWTRTRQDRDRGWPR